MTEERLIEIWGTVIGLLKEESSDTVINLWFGGSRLRGINDENRLAVISIPSKMRSEYVEQNYKERVENLLYALLGSRYTLAVTHEENGSDPVVVLSGGTPESNDAWVTRKAETIAETPEPIRAARARAAGIFANSEYEFENFVEGNSNNFACAVCKAVAQNPAPMYKKKGDASSKYYNPLFIYGPSGVGKTHLLYAVAKRINAQYPELSIVYVKGDDFTNEMVESIARHTTGEFREKYRHAQVLLIDDVQFIAGKEATQLEFFHTFNELYEENCQIILTCDRPPKDIEMLEDRLRTRFEWGITVDIQVPDVDLRLAILRKKCEMCNINPPSDVLAFLADKLRNNIRQLEGAVKKIAARHMLTGEPIDMEMVLANVSDLIGGEQSEQVTIDRILSLVGQKFNVPVMELRGKKRTKEIANARHVAIYLIRKLTNLSYPLIGREFDRDHATIMSSEANIAERIVRDPLFEMEMQNMVKELS